MAIIVILLIVSAIFFGIHIHNRGRINQSEMSDSSDITSINNINEERNMETEIMEYFANARYNQTDTWFRFKYKKVGSEWRAYIIRTPSLNGKSPDAHLTHRYSDGNGNYWVCRDPQTTTLHDAQVVSRVWADRFLEYTVTGVEANSQVW